MPAASAHVVTGTWATQRIEHLFLEPESALAVPLEDGRLHLYSQGQGIFDDRRQVASVLGEPEERLFVELVPNANHAGTTPMRLRHDAGFAAAAITVFARRLAREMGGSQVATVGAVSLAPNLVNVIAERAVITVDLRNTDEARLAEAERRLFAFAEETAAAEGVGLSRRTLARFEPVTFDPELVARVEAIAKDLRLSVKRLPSGAGHDAQMLAAVCPACMIFVPSARGVSHNVEEYTSPADLAAGADVLLRLVRELAG